VVEAERRLLTVTWDRVETEFRQRQPVSEQRHEQTTDRHQWALRFGVERTLGRR
jgi:hypothetical protein